jgi:hypothetical protein
MRPVPIRLVLRILGALLLAIAAIRFAIVFFRTVFASELTPPDLGFQAGFKIDNITLVLGAIGVLALLVSFRAKRH